MQKAVHSSHNAKTKQQFKMILLFFLDLFLFIFRENKRSTEVVLIFLDAWIYSVQLRGSIFTLNYTKFCIFHKQDTFIAVEDGLKEQSIDIFELIGIWCVVKRQPKGGVQYLILDVAFVNDENKEYIHYIHGSMYRTFWISETVYPAIT